MLGNFPRILSVHDLESIMEERQGIAIRPIYKICKSGLRHSTFLKINSTGGEVLISNYVKTTLITNRSLLSGKAFV